LSHKEQGLTFLSAINIHNIVKPTLRFSLFYLPNSFQEVDKFKSWIDKTCSRLTLIRLTL